MAEWLNYLLLAVGAALIIRGGDMFVGSASWIAEVSGVPRFVVGATIVSVATTMPELTVSLIATLSGRMDMAVGNAIGSVIVNTALILAIALIFIRTEIKRRVLLPKAVILIASMLLVWLGSARGVLSIWAAAALLAAFALYIFFNIRDAKSESIKSGRPKYTRRILIRNIVLFVFGAAMVVIGSDLLVESGSAAARDLGVPEGVIAVTLIALGTSLPELVTAVAAIVKKQPGLSLGNIVGANILDLALIIPVSSIAAGGALTISGASLGLDMPACLAFLLIAFLPPIFSGKFYRWQGFALLAGYGVYLVLLLA